MTLRAHRGRPLGASAGHAGPTTVTFETVVRSIPAETRPVLLHACRTVLCVVTVLRQELTAAVILGWRVPTGALNTTISANQAVISVVSAVRHIRWTSARDVVVHRAIGTEILIGMIGAVRTVVSIGAGMIVGIGMKAAVRTVRRVILSSGRSAAPGVIAVIVAGRVAAVAVALPAVVGDVSVVIVDNRAATATPLPAQLQFHA